MQSLKAELRCGGDSAAHECFQMEINDDNEAFYVKGTSKRATPEECAAEVTNESTRGGNGVYKIYITLPGK